MLLEASNIAVNIFSVETKWKMFATSIKNTKIRCVEKCLICVQI